MTISKLATEIWPLAKTKSGHNRFYKRSGKPQGAIIHHAATTVDNGLKYAYVSPQRELSSNYAMRKDATLVGILHEEYRAFTSASPKADDWGITIEIVNSTGAPGWGISSAQFEMIARWLADMSLRWGWGPLTRNNVIGHREVLGRFGQGYATECPGGIWSLMDKLIARANQYRVNASDPGTPKPSTPTTPAVSGSALLKGVGLNDTVSIKDWFIYSDAALTKNRRKVTGTYKIVGITYKARANGEPSLHLQDAKGGKAWAHYSAVAGVVKPSSTPAPTPTPTPAPAKKLVIGATIRLKDTWAGFTYKDLRSKQYPSLPPGDYKVTGIANGNIHIEGNRRDAWIHGSAAEDGLV